jgi:hypothetical protein
MVPSDDRLIALLTQANPALPDEGLDLDFGVSCIDLGFEINRIGELSSNRSKNAGGNG